MDIVIAKFLIFFALFYGLGKLIRSTPSAIRFGMENREAVRGGCDLLKRLFRR